MKPTTQLLMATVFGVLSSVFGGCSKPEYEPADVYVGLRGQVLKLTAEQIHFSPSAENPKVLAMLMETGYSGAVATLVSVTDGAASLYFSNGGGIIGSGENEAPKAASKALVRAAEQYVKDCKRVTEFPLPHKGSTRFYFVTVGGVFSMEAPEDDLGDNRHRLSPLFHKAHQLITQIRLEDEKRSAKNSK